MDDRVITGHIPGIDDQNINNNKVTTNILSQKTIIVSILAVIIIILFIIWPYISAKLNLINKENDYQKALKEYESKNYQHAQNIFDSLKDYKDSYQKSAQCSFEIELLNKEKDYKKALKEYENKNYQQAQNIFNSLNDYKDSNQKSAQCSFEIELLNKENVYRKALSEYTSKNYQQAQSLFLSLKDYKDSFKRSIKCEFMSKVGIEFCLCPAGKFKMVGIEEGLFFGESKFECNIHITNDFYIGKYEVTQKQYKIIMENNPSINNKNSDNFPVENVSWDKANEFCAKLTEKYKGMLEEGYIFDLPTEAEWEYACRAGTTESRYGDLDKIAWTKNNSDNKTHEVGQKQPNTWGIYDMLGNVLEWCKDDYTKTIPHDKNTVYTDPCSNNKSGKKIFKGGSYSQDISKVRADYRDSDTPTLKYPNLGFRVAIVKNRKAISSQNN